MALHNKTGPAKGGFAGIDSANSSRGLAADSAIRARLATFGKNHCPQCSEWLLAPEWSEYFSDRCVRHTWSCDACGYQFETAVFFAGAA